MRLQQPRELQERGGAGHALGAQVDAGKAAQGMAVVEGVFERFLGQAIPLLEKIDPRHPLHADGRTAARTLGVMWLNHGQQLAPRQDFLHAGEELLAPGDLLLPPNSARAKPIMPANLDTSRSPSVIHRWRRIKSAVPSELSKFLERLDVKFPPIKRP